jgi:hypothetical protein
LSGNHDIFSVRERAEFRRERFPSFPTHENDFAVCQLFKMLNIFRMPPHEFIAFADAIVFCDCGDERERHRLEVQEDNAQNSEYGACRLEHGEVFAEDEDAAGEHNKRIEDSLENADIYEPHALNKYVCEEKNLK